MIFVKFTLLGIFNDNKYFDITAEYAKRSAEEVLGVITVTNHASEEATCHVLPTLWYRNTWIWGCRHEGCTMKPLIKQIGDAAVHCKHDTLPKCRFYWGPDQEGNSPQLLFTENETNSKVNFTMITIHVIIEGIDTEYLKKACHNIIVKYLAAFMYTFFIYIALFQLCSRYILSCLP